MEKNDNDKKIVEYKKRKAIKWIVIILSLAVIVLEVLALCNVISMLWGCGVFIIIYFLKKFL